MDVREAIDSQGDLHNNSVAHPLETLGPRLFPAAEGGGMCPTWVSDSFFVDYYL